MELFYAHPEKITESSILLDRFEANHLTKTLRKKTGDQVDVTDGNGKHYCGTINSIKPELTIFINSVKDIIKEKPGLALGMAYIRPNRLEFILEKCTELGVDTFFLFRSEHANYFSDNKERYEKILRQAIKQSNRYWLPNIQLFKNFKSFIQHVSHIPVKVAAIDANSPPLKSVLPLDEQEKMFCIGPEGGFSKNEIIQMNENGFFDVSLGSYRLRAETAAIAGVSKLIL